MAVNLDVIQAPVLATPTLSDDGSLAADTTYYYCVIAIGGQDALHSYRHHFESPRSNIVEITTTSTQKTVNLTWPAATITQSGSYNTAYYQHDAYAVLRSTDKADLEGKEGVPILINTGYTTITTTTNSLTDDGVTPGTTQDPKSYFWYRPHGCPKIHIDGGTEENPYTMEDLYNADIAGTLELLPEVEATDTPHRLRTPVNPADSKQLALDVVVTSYTSAGSVTLTGKDAGGDAKSETITINGTGTFTSTKTYASIDEDGVTCTGDFTFKIIQNRWGFVERHKFQFGNNVDWGSNNYTLHCSFFNEGYFLTKKENIFIAGGFNPGINTNAHFTAGELSSVGTGKRGSNITFMNRRWFAGQNAGFITGMSLYASKVQYLGSNYCYYYTSNTATWFGGSGDWRLGVNNTVTMVDSVFDIPTEANGFLINSPPNITRGLHVGAIQPRPDDTTYDFGGLTLAEGNIQHQIDDTCELQNLNIYNASYDIRYWQNGAHTFSYKNLTFHRDSQAEEYNEPFYYFYGSYTNQTTGTFKSDLSLTIIDEAGNPIEGATVKVVRSDDTVEDTVTTNSDGETGEIAVVYATTAIDGTAGGNTTGYATNNRGNLTPVTPRAVQTNYTHTVTISKSGYLTKKVKYTLTTKTTEIETLEKMKDLNFSDNIMLRTQ